jgi:hypothetical protein
MRLFAIRVGVGVMLVAITTLSYVLFPSSPSESERGVDVKLRFFVIIGGALLFWNVYDWTRLKGRSRPRV